MLPVGLGPLVTGAHAYTGLLWVVLRVAQTQEAHCGYSWPWSPFRWLPANGSGFAHDAHHALNTGNFGRCGLLSAFVSAHMNTRLHRACSLFGFWDSYCGTRIKKAALSAKYDPPSPQIINGFPWQSTSASG